MLSKILVAHPERKNVPLSLRNGKDIAIFRNKNNVCPEKYENMF